MDRERELLIELRSKLIGELNTLPFTVYDDETLERLLVAKPKTIDELSKIKGFPAKGKRVKGFGELIVKIFNDADNVEGIKLEGSGMNIRVSATKPMKLF